MTLLRCSFFLRTQVQIGRQVMGSTVPAVATSSAATYSDSGKREHLVLTASHTRDPNMFQAQIKSIADLSPTIKGFKLKVLETDAERGKPVFKAGQWVDLFIPGVETVGGYSMCSDPLNLEVANELDLAVKHSSWPPTLWLHTRAEIGSRVSLRVGGDFTYPNETTNESDDCEHNLLLVGGGVGINPLASILRHSASRGRANVRLLFSASTEEELIFRNDLDAVCETSSKVKVRYFATREKPLRVDTVHRRMTKSDVEETLKEFETGNPVFCYICGPTSLIEWAANVLPLLNVRKSHIFYELWW